MVDSQPNLSKVQEEFTCEICMLNKFTSKKFGKERSRAKDILKLIHTNVCGPIKQLGCRGEQFFVHS